MCTAIRLKTKDNKIVCGRTAEFGAPLECSIIILPKGTDFEGDTNSGKGMSFQTKYDIVGTTVFDEKLVLDGMNEKGLCVSALYFPGFAEYQEVDKSNQDNALSPLDYVTWLLGEFGSIDELKNGFNKATIVSTKVKAWFNLVPPMHWVMHDKSGKCVVIEPVDGKLVMSENPLGVFTNSPDFRWHMTNLTNYMNLSTHNIDTAKLGDVEIKSSVQGSGLHGLPGDFTPASRFVRAAFFSNLYTQSDNTIDAANGIFHILNQFDIPEGTVKDGNFSDHTQMTAACDPNSLDYYFKGYKNQNIKKVNLAEGVCTSIVRYKVDSKTQEIENVIDKLEIY